MLTTRWSVVSKHVGKLRRFAHEKLRRAWNPWHSNDCDDNTLNQLANIHRMQNSGKWLMMVPPQPGGMDDEDTSCASVEDTTKAILSALTQRQAFLGRKGITDKGYRLTPTERGDMAK